MGLANDKGLIQSVNDPVCIHYLALKTGRWGDQQILSEEWLTMAETAASANRGYGFMTGF